MLDRIRNTRAGLVKLLHTRPRRWAAMAVVFAVLAALFHPLFLVLGGVIGALTFGVTVLGGFVLGPLDGVLFAVITSALSIPLWTREYGFSLTENISGPVISVLLALGAGWTQRIVQRARAQSESLKRTNQALQEAQLQLLQAEKLVLFGEVAAGVAHELNQPLALIGLAAQIGQQDLRKGHTGELDDRLATIRAQVRRAGQIIRRLKSTGREGGSDERRDCSLNDIVRNVTMQFQPQLQALGIGMQIRLGPALAPVHCSSTQMEQMLACLLLNARDAVHGASEKRIVVSTADGGEFLGLDVEDSGAGIPSEVMPRIFDPFFTTKEVGAGSGLGLPICHRIVSDHGGQLDVSSVVGQGTRFSVRLPPAPPPGERAPLAAPPAAGPRPRALSSGP